MARVKVGSLVGKLNYDFERALGDAVKEVLPSAEFDENELFRAFKRVVGRKFSQWVRVPDHYVQQD